MRSQDSIISSGPHPLNTSVVLGREMDLRFDESSSIRMDSYPITFDI